MAISKAKQEQEQSLASHIDDGLLYLNCADNISRFRFGPACFCSADSLVAFERYRISTGKRPVVDFDEVPADWNSTIFFSGRKGKYQVVRTEAIGFQERLRMKSMGLIRGVLDKVARTVSVEVMADGRTEARERLFHLDQKQGNNPFVPFSRMGSPTGKQKWCFSPSGRYEVYNIESGGDESLEPACCLSVAWGLPRIWSIRIGPQNAVPLVFMTDPSGVKGFFHLRDKPEGRTRREALQHWVKAHTRTLRSDPDTEIEVRRHLRGATEFRWFDLTCKVIAPEEPV